MATRSPLSATRKANPPVHFGLQTPYSGFKSAGIERLID